MTDLYEEPEIFAIIKKIRYDLTAAQTKVSEALRMLSDMELPMEPKGTPCPRCGIPIKGGERTLAFHLYNVHGEGELPALSPLEEAS